MTLPDNSAPSAQPTADDCWRKANTAAVANDGAGAEHWLRQCLALKPGYPNAALNLGRLLMQRGNHTEAEPFLQEAARNSPNIESYTVLADQLLATGRVDNAAPYLKHILKNFPNHAPTLMRMAEWCEMKSDRIGARSYFGQAMAAAPADMAIAMKYAVASWTDDPAATIAVFERFMAQSRSDGERIQLLSSMLMYKEFHERMKRGLMPYHATGVDELFFTHAAPEFAEYRRLVLKQYEEHPNDKIALQSKFIAMFCSRDRRGAQECLGRMARAGSIWETVTFDPDFYRSLERFTDADLAKGLPPVSDVLTAAFDDEPVAYLSCNYAYFAAFCVPMLRSLADKAPGAQVHVHVMDVTDQQIAEAVAVCRDLGNLRIALSVEQPGVDKQGLMVARCYYHAVRFIRYYQHLKRYGRTLWLMDVDALFNRDPRIMYKVLGDNDAAMRIRAGRIEPWNQFNACIVAATPKPASVEYFRLIAAYVAHFFQRNQLRWGIDQMAMYGVYEYLRDEGRAPSLAFLDDRAIDYVYLDDGIVWCNSGKKKFVQLQRNPDGSPIIDDPVRAKYLILFDKYCTPPKA